MTIVLKRSECTSTIVEHGKCITLVDNAEPGEACISCVNNYFCYKKYCHRLCAPTDLDCLTVNTDFGSKRIRQVTGCKMNHGCLQENEFLQTCARTISGPSCPSEYEGSMDICDGDRVRKCYKGECRPICVKSGDCESGFECKKDKNFSYYEGVCMESTLPGWAIPVSAIIGVVSFILLIAFIVYIIRKRRRRLNGTSQRTNIQPLAQPIIQPLAQPTAPIMTQRPTQGPPPISAWSPQTAVPSQPRIEPSEEDLPAYTEIEHKR